MVTVITLAAHHHHHGGGDWAGGLAVLAALGWLLSVIWGGKKRPTNPKDPGPPRNKTWE